MLYSQLFSTLTPEILLKQEIAKRTDTDKTDDWRGASKREE